MSLRGRLGGNEIVFRHSMIRPLMQEGKSYCIGFDGNRLISCRQAGRRTMKELAKVQSIVFTGTAAR